MRFASHDLATNYTLYCAFVMTDEITQVSTAETSQNALASQGRITLAEGTGTRRPSSQIGRADSIETYTMPGTNIVYFDASVDKSQ